jgi:peptide/nickel transport system permease protein
MAPYSRSLRTSISGKCFTLSGGVKVSQEGYSLKSYVLSRILQAIPLIFVVIVLNFVLIHTAPGDPIVFIAGEFGDPEYYDMMRAHYGLDKPIHERLVMYIGNVLKGDLGRSYFFRQPVIQVIAERIPATLLLMGTAALLASVLGIVVGVVSSSKPYSIRDNLITAGSLMGYSLPVFWLAQMLLIVLALWLGIFPAQGITSLRIDLTGIEYVLDVLHHLVLPASSLAIYHLALIARLTRANMLEVLQEDYITTAFSKGLSERRIVYRHALKNALLPVVTVIGMELGFMIAGAVLTETVYSWPGLGRLMYDSIYTRDYPVLMGLFIVISISVIIANLATDIVYGLLDPRIRHR